MTDSLIACPNCGADVVDGSTFCSNCGSPLGPVACEGCGREIAAGARFCGNCGRPIGGGAPQSLQRQGSGPGHGGTTALLALVGLVVVVGIAWLIGSGALRKNAPGAPGASATTGPVAGDANATDIWEMSPRERFTRLSDRIERAYESGDSAQVVQFFPMATGAFEMLPESDRDADARFHMAMMLSEVGQMATAQAQVDSLMLQSPGNLLGYWLIARLATIRGDSTAARAARASFMQGWDSEIASGQEEYTAHRNLLDKFHQEAESD